MRTTALLHGSHDRAADPDTRRPCCCGGLPRGAQGIEMVLLLFHVQRCWSCAT